MIKLVLAIRSLDIGGAERQFIELVKHIDKTRFNVLVVTMYGGVQENTVKNIPNIKYINLQKKGRYDFFAFYNRYARILQESAPDIIYSFLVEMNLFSYWCKLKKTKLIWGFRASNMDLKKYGKLAQILFWLQRIYSRNIDKIIVNSYASVIFHKNSGFDMSKSVVIHNGIDTNKFTRNLQKRKEFREKYNLKVNDTVIGIVARIDYMKGYVVLVTAIKKILDNYQNITMFAIGDDDKSIKQECEKILGCYNNIRFIWLGKQNNVENFYSGFDVYSSSSFGEGFSNSIAEAMSCELACVVTNVGDSKIIVGNIGIVVDANNEQSLYDGLVKMIESDYKDLGKKSSNRIISNFTINKMVDNTAQHISILLEHKN